MLTEKENKLANEYCDTTEKGDSESGIQQLKMQRKMTKNWTKKKE